MRYGEPVAAFGNSAASSPDDADAVRDLTAAVALSLRGVTINAPDWETLRVLDEVRRLYQPPRIPLAARIELARRFAEVYNTVRDDPQVRALYERVSAYHDRQCALGIGDAEIRHRPSFFRAVLKVAIRTAALVFWLPLALPGALLHAPIGVVVVGLTHRLARRKDTIAATKLLAAAALSVVLYGLVLLAATWWYGAWGLLATALGLPLAGIATVRVVDRVHALRRLGLRSFRGLAYRRELAELRTLRAQLEQDVLELVDRLRPANMVPMFPRDAPLRRGPS